MPSKREDDFARRRQHLADLSEQELEEKFWELAEEIVEPIMELASTHTSPSIERSVLLRMGFNSVDAKAIVKKINEAGLLGKGAGHVIYRLAEKEDLEVKEAGLEIKNGNFEARSLQNLFSGGEK